MLKNVNILQTFTLLNYKHFHAHEHLASHQHSLGKYHVIDVNSYACRHRFPRYEVKGLELNELSGYLLS